MIFVRRVDKNDDGRITEDEVKEVRTIRKEVEIVFDLFLCICL